MSKTITRDDIMFQPPVVDKYIQRGASICAPVAVSLALKISFDNAYMLLANTGMKYGIMMNSNRIITKVLEYKFNRIRRGNLQLIDSTLDPISCKLEDVVVALYNDEQATENGYLVSTLHKGVQHIRYIKGLTIYDGVIGVHGKIQMSKDRDVLTSTLDELVVSVWVPKPSDELVYCDPRVELFHEILVCGKVHGLFGGFHIDKSNLYNGFSCYDVEGDENGNPKKIVSSVGLNNWIGCFITRDSSLVSTSDSEICLQKGDWQVVDSLTTYASFRYRYRK